jgi:hypothetical protein
MPSAKEINHAVFSKWFSKRLALLKGLRMDKQPTALDIALNELERVTACWRRVETAAKELIALRRSTFRARNGREVGIEGDDGEKCWIVHSDQMTALEAAIEENVRSSGCGGESDAAAGR